MSYVLKEFSSYNGKRYGKPWGAIIIMDNGKPAYKFDSGYFAGTAYEGGDVIIADVSTGDIVAFGQKDHRGNSSTNDWYVVNDDLELEEISRNDAVKLLMAAEK